MDDILTKIVERKRERLSVAKTERPVSSLRDNRRQARSYFQRELQRDAINVIAEIKRRSPSKGIIRNDFDPARIASNYLAGGAAAISILTEEDFFDGSLEHLREVRSLTDLPILRKDFIFDEYQLPETIDAGADAILLIAAMLEDGLFHDLLQATHALGLEALVEVHDLAEIERVLRFDIRVLGVNNRNLRTFVTDIQTSIDLVKSLPDSLTLVSESGIRTRADIERLRDVGYNAFLIGEELMRSGDEQAALLALTAR
jgi:indole-3-glycerol phosphate synthase